MFITGEKPNTTAVLSILKCLPSGIYEPLSMLSFEKMNTLEEILIMAGKPLIVFQNGEGFFVNGKGELSNQSENCIRISDKHVKEAFRLICDSSVYASEEDIQKGFVTIEGGHRVGICGSGVTVNGRVSAMKDITALNIRIARQAQGCAKAVMPHIEHEGRIRNTLIISPPGCGKTTLLRDIARIIGSGLGACGPKKTGIVDERGELGAVSCGMVQNDVGLCSMVMDKIPKPEGMMMLLRSMGPEVIITDEIGTMDDVVAIKSLLCSGVSVIATAHAATKEQAFSRAEISELTGGDGFERIVVLSRREGPGTVEEVYCIDN